MSQATSNSSSTRGTRLVVAWLAGLVAVIVVVVVLVPAPAPPYAIDNEQADGTDILRRVLVDLDVETVEGPAADVVDGLDPADVAVVFVDRLSDADEQSLQAHRAAGGDLVVADPRSALASPSGGGLEVVAGVGVAGPPGCDLLPDRLDVDLSVDGFAGVGVADVPDLVEIPQAATATCWDRDGRALVVQHRSGGLDDGTDGGTTAPGSGGTTTVVADVDVLTNGAIMAQPVLGQFANLFVPDGDGRVVVVVGDQAPPAGTGVPGAPPPNLVDAMWLAGIAVVVYALARARRHGRVLVEAPPVEVPASELAIGIAELLQRHGEAGSAAARLRAELRARVGPRMGVSGVRANGPTAGADVGVDLVEPIVHATGLDRATVDRAVRDRPVTDTAELLEVAAAVRRVQEATLPEPDRVPPGRPEEHR